MCGDIIMIERGIDFPDPTKRAGQVIVRRGEVGIEADRLAKGGDALLKPFQVDQCRPQIAARLRAIGGEPDRFAQACQRLLVVAQSAIRFSQADLIDGDLWGELDRAFEPQAALLGMAELKLGDAEQMKHVVPVGV
jgi:hypothetical protein